MEKLDGKKKRNEDIVIDWNGSIDGNKNKTF
jgi:hypothetical protein